MPTIVFEPLVSSPQTLGDSVISFPRLRVLGVESGDIGGVFLPPLRVVGVAQQNTFETGAGLVSFPALQMYGSEPIAPYLGVNAWGAVRLSHLTATGIDNLAPVPQDGSGVVTLPELQVVATGLQNLTGTGVVTLPSLFVYGREVAGNDGLVTLPSLFVRGTQVIVLPTGSIYGSPQPIASILGSYTWVLYDTITLTDTLLSDALILLESQITFDDTLSPLADLIMALQSNLTAFDAFRFFFEIAVNDTVDFTDEPTITPLALLALADQLMLADESLTLGDTLIALASAFVAADYIKSSLGVELLSAVDLADAITSNFTLITQLVSDALLIDEVSGVLMMSTLLSDSIVFDDDINRLFAVLMELADGIDFAVHFRTPDGEVYAGYMMNVRTAAMSELTNFKFNSFATIGGQTFAAGVGGIYQLGGDTDAGAEIDARVRLGLEDFGTSQLKRVPNAYIGYTSSGRLLLKTITTDGGTKKENWYSLKPRAATSPVENRFDIAKGLVARYWGWEITNIDGADFELDSLKVWPMVLQRRKSGR